MKIPRNKKGGQGLYRLMGNLSLINYSNKNLKNLILGRVLILVNLKIEKIKEEIMTNIVKIAV